MAFEGLISTKRKSVEGQIVDDGSGKRWTYMISFEITNTSYTFQGSLFAAGGNHIPIRRRTEPGKLGVDECERFGLNVAKEVLKASNSRH